MLLGLGGLFAGSATLVGTGAFTAVQADRTVTVNTASDSNALVQIEAYNKSEQFVTTNGGTVAIDITNPGLNSDTITAVDQLLEVTNNGSEKVIVGFEAEYAADVEEDFEGDAEEVSPYGYTFATNDTADVGVVVWASPKEKNMDNTYAEVRPDLTTTGFGFPSDSSLVDGRTIRDEIVQTIDRDDVDPRKIDPSESVNIGIVITTRDRTINQNSGIPPELDSNINLVAKSAEDIG
jgi:Protein of unknown function (DUF1102).